MELRNGAKYWVCICSLVQSGSTYCAKCSHKPFVLKAVTKRKHWWRTRNSFTKKCLALSERDLRIRRRIDGNLKWNKIRMANNSLLADRNREMPEARKTIQAKSSDKYREIQSHYFNQIESVKNGKSTEVSRNEMTQGATGLVDSQTHKLKAKNAIGKPAPALELDPTNFEWYCAEWCVYFGHANVRVTRSTKDGGIDVHGDGFIAQVKLQELPVGVKAIRELAGLVSIRQKAIGYFFTVNGYSMQAIAEANELGLAIFVVLPFQAEIIPKSELASLIVEDARLAGESF